MGKSDERADSLTLEGVGGLFNGEVFVLVPGQSGTIGRSSIATFPVTVSRNHRRLEGDPARDGLVAAMHPEHVRFLYVGGGRLIIENLAGRDVVVGHREVPDRIDVDLAKGGVEVRFGYGERILATFPGSEDELQKLAPPSDVDAAVEAVFNALLRPDGTLAIGGDEGEAEYSLAAPDGEPVDAESDTGEIPRLSEEEIAEARKAARPKKRRRLFGLRPPVLFSILFHLVVILGLFSTIRIIEGHGGGDEFAEVSMATPEPPTETPKDEPPPEAEFAETPSETEPMTPTVEDAVADDFPGESTEAPGDARESTGLDGMMGVGAAGGPDGLGPAGATRSADGAGSRGGKQSGPLLRALTWLAEHQKKDGSWGGISSVTDCGKCRAPAQREYEVAMTGLAILAFAGGGNTHRKGPHARRVMRAVRWLAKRQQKDGSFHGTGTPRDDREMYGDAIATLALAELSRVDGTPLLRAALSRALRHLERSQTPYAGWRYQPGEVESDTSVTAWAMLALTAAERADVEVNPMVRAGARGWLGTVVESRSHRVGYRERGRGSLGMSAAGLTIMQGLDRKRFAPAIRAASNLLKTYPPSWPQMGAAPAPGNPPDVNYWFFGTVAARRAGGDLWRSWSRSMKRALAKSQESAGHERGSFGAVGRWSRAGGRVYATASAAVCLAMCADLPGALK